MEDENTRQSDENSPDNLATNKPPSRKRDEHKGKPSPRNDKSQDHDQNSRKWSLLEHWHRANNAKRIRWVIAGLGLVVSICILGVYICDHVQSERHFQIEHTGRAYLSRPPQLLGPVESDIEHRKIDLPNIRLWFKATGDIKRAYALPFLATLVPDKPTGNHNIDNPFPIVTDALCQMDQQMIHSMGYYGFPIQAGQEISMDISSSSQNLPIDFDAKGQQKLSLGWEEVAIDASVRLYVPACAIYTDEYNVSHASCDTYQFVPDNYMGNSFPSGKQISGRFALSALGSCSR